MTRIPRADSTAAILPRLKMMEWMKEKGRVWKGNFSPPLGLVAAVSVRKDERRTEEGAQIAEFFLHVSHMREKRNQSGHGLIRKRCRPLCS